MSDHLSLPIYLPDEEDKRFERLATLIRRVANHVLEDHWTPVHLDGIADASHQAWKYFDEHEPFEELDLYLPPRFRRCILQKVGETLRSHTDRRDAFQSIQSIKSDASTVVAPKNNSGMTVTTSRQATWTSSSTNSPATTTVTGRIQPRISKCKAVQSTIAASRCSLRTTAQPAVKPSNTSTTPMVRC